MKRMALIAACAAIAFTLTGLLMSGPLMSDRAQAATSGAVAVAVADFDYRDTSGEVKDQMAQHAKRMRIFAGMLRERLSADRHYDVRTMDCAKRPCSVGNMSPDTLIAAARRAGARLLVYGGIHKMSTLIQWGKVQVVDLRQNKLLLNRTFTFRGDTDKAFRKAAEFVVQTLQGVAPKS